MIACVDIEDTSIEDDTIAEMEARIQQLESIVQTQSTMLSDIATAAGYKMGEAYTVPALIARLRDGDR